MGVGKGDGNAVLETTEQGKFEGVEIYIALRGNNFRRIGTCSLPVDIDSPDPRNLSDFRYSAVKTRTIP